MVFYWLLNLSQNYPFCSSHVLLSFSLSPPFLFMCSHFLSFFFSQLLLQDNRTDGEWFASASLQKISSALKSAAVSKNRLNLALNIETNGGEAPTLHSQLHKPGGLLHFWGDELSISTSKGFCKLCHNLSLKLPNGLAVCILLIATSYTKVSRVFHLQHYYHHLIAIDYAAVAID